MRSNTKRELGEATAHDYDSSASSRGRFSTGHFPVEDTSAKAMPAPIRPTPEMVEAHNVAHMHVHVYTYLYV